MTPGRRWCAKRVLLWSGFFACIALPASSNAQLGGLLGSTSGSYCKFKKKDAIRVNTTLSLEHSEAFTRQMTLRRLASMARSKGFSGLVITDKGCGTMLVNHTPRFRICKLEAQMVNSTDIQASAKGVGKWSSVENILVETQSDARSYPRSTGLMDKGNQCVID
jgi:hypothetical protein